MNWQQQDSGADFVADCEACDAPIFVTRADRTPERFIYQVTCPACGAAAYLVRFGDARERAMRLWDVG